MPAPENELAERAASAVVAMDGPSGSGKSSASRGVAAALGLRYLDTGAMYRAVTCWMLEHGVDVDDPDAVAARAGEPVLVSGTDPGAPTITVDGVDVSGPIRGPEVTGAVSAVASVPAVRERMVALQREVIGAGGIVVEGRDIGSTVAPDAALKVYLTADPEVRAQRRAAEVAAANGEADRVDPTAVDEHVAAMSRRDAHDSSRAASPLTRADGAVELDATHLTLEQVVDTVLDLLRAALTGRRPGASASSS